MEKRAEAENGKKNEKGIRSQKVTGREERKTNSEEKIGRKMGDDTLAHKIH